MPDRDDDTPALPGETDDADDVWDQLEDDADAEGDSDESPGLRARLWGTLLAIITAPLRGLRWIGGKLSSFATRAQYRAKNAFLRFIMGSHPNTSRLLATVVVGSGLLAGVGLMAILTRELETSASSGPVITMFFAVATSPWAWALGILILFRQLLFFGDRLLARITASESGFSYQTIRRLAEEAKRPDLDQCERVLVQSGDSPAQIAAWLVDAFEGNGHDAPTFTPSSADDGDDRRRQTDGLALPDADGATTEDDDATDETPSDPDFWTQLRLFRLELASAVDLTGVLWRFVVPSLLVFVGLMLWARIWVQPIVVAVIGLASLFLGGVYYWAVDLRHRRRLAALRATETPTRWTDLAILTKTVDVPETTMYFGYLDGNVYASEDKHDLAETLADRAIDRLEGRQPAPAIEETNAYLLKRYVPMLEAWEQEHERKAIMDQLINTVADAPEGIIPRSILMDQVIEHDRRYVAWGLLFIGRGRDPDLVREVYQDLVEIHALAETPVTVKGTESGEERELVAVTKGDETFPPEVVQLRGEFDSLFGKQAFQTRYTEPDVKHATTPTPFIRPETHESAD